MICAFISFQLFLRIYHVIKNTLLYKSIKSLNMKLPRLLAIFFVNPTISYFIKRLSTSLFASLLTASLASAPAQAESNVISNVTGDQMIIYTDESYKPAIRDIGSIGDQTYNEVAQKESEKKNTYPSSNNASPEFLNGAGVAPKYAKSRRLGEVPEIQLDEPPNQSSATAPASSYPTASGVSADVVIHTDDLWQRIKNGYAMPESTSNLTVKHEQWYSSRPDYIERMVKRSQRYLFHIVEEVEKRGMPTEIALLPMIESAYNPQAYSTSHASGIWQFVPSTGKFFGLKQNWWVDNRRNITFATDAALSYLQKLYGMFGAWDLALAAYNAGEGTVGRAIERNRKLGLPTDYESLNLPVETKNYVPKLQAVKNLMTNPSNYGLNIQTIANTPYFAKVTAPAQMDAHLAAKLAEISDDEFLALNPSYNRPVISNENKNLELLLPILSAQTFRSNLASYNKPLVSWQTYFAKRGESMDKIANKFGIKLDKLRDVNNLPAHTKMKNTATILVPKNNSADFNADKAKLATPTETLAVTEAVNLASTEQTLSNQSSANIDMSGIQSASTQTVSESSTGAESNTERKITHKVKKGEGLQSIANRYGISVKKIMTENSLKNQRIRAGQALNIRIEASQKSTSDIKEKSSTIVAKNNKKTNKKQTYTVKRGDTLHSIAGKFDVSVTDLRRWNKKTDSNIQSGNKLNILQSDVN